MALSQIHADRTPSLANSNGKVSCASHLDTIGKALAHPKSVENTSAHLSFLWTIYCQTSCLTTKDVPCNDNKDSYHLFGIVSTTNGGV